MANNNLRQVVSGGRFLFGEEVACVSELAAGAVSSTQIAFTNVQGLGTSTPLPNGTYTGTLRNVTQGTIYYNAEVTVSTPGVINFAIIPDRIIGGTQTTPINTDLWSFRLYNTPERVGRTTLSMNVEKEYDDFMDENNNKLRSYIINRKVTANGEVENVDFTNIHRFYSFERITDDNLLMTDETDLTRGLMIVRGIRTLPNSTGTETYEFRFWDCELKPNGEMVINPREARKKIAYMVDANYDIVTRGWCQFHKE